MPDLRGFAIKFFLDTDAFRTEAALYASASRDRHPSAAAAAVAANTPSAPAADSSSLTILPDGQTSNSTAHNTPGSGTGQGEISLKLPQSAAQFLPQVTVLSPCSQLW